MQHMEKTENVIKYFLWKVFSFENLFTITIVSKFSFKSRKCHPPIKDLESFKADLWNIAKKVRLQHCSNPFLKSSNDYMAKTKQSSNIHILADKTKTFMKQASLHTQIPS